STWGIGQDLSANAWRDLVEQLLFEGLLREDPNDGRPLVGVGDADRVRGVFRRERRVQIQTREEEPAGRVRKARKGREALVTAPSDHALFEALRAWRARAAKSH